DLDAGQPAPQVRYHPREQACFTYPQAMGQAVKPDRVQTGITEHHFELVARRRVPVKYAGDIFLHPVEHAQRLRAPDAWTPMVFWVSVSMPRSMFISTRLGWARPNSRRKRGISLRGCSGSRKPISISTCCRWV